MLPPSAEGSVSGFIVYLAAVLIPGVGFGELLGAWKKEDGLAEKLGYVLGIGLSVDTLVLTARASGVTVFGYTLVGLDLNVVYFLVGTGVLALLISVAARRSFALPNRPTRVEGILLLSILIQAGVVLLFYQKFPIYPAYPSQDFRNHAEEAQGLISGTITMLPGGVLYYAGISQISLALMTAGGFALTTAEQTMSILTLLSPLIVYLAALRVFSNKTISLLVAVLYSLSGTVWYVSVFDAGLYPNFFGILASLFMIVAYVDAVHKQGRIARWSVFLLAMVMFYMSHFSVIVLLPVIFLVPFYQLAKDRTQFKRYLVPALVLCVPAAAAGVVLPGLYPYVIALIESGRGNFLSQSFLGGILSGIPVLGYMAGELNDDIEFLLLMFLLVVYLLRFRKGSSLLVIPVVWFFILVLAPISSNTWRFAFEAVIPLLFMAGFAIHSFTIEERRPGRKRLRTNISKGWRTAIIVGALVLPVIVGSWGTEVVADSTTNGSLVNQSQQGVYNATLWMAQNTKPNATFLSLTDWRFSYLNDSIGRQSFFRFFSLEQPAVTYARLVGARYIIVTFVVTIPLPSSATIYPWNNFKPSPNFTLAYSNQFVEIFKIS
jgi:hypothetical protein